MTTAADLADELMRPDGAPYTTVLLVQQDPTLQRLVLAWPAVRVTDPTPDQPVPAGLAGPARTRWFWCRLEPDVLVAWIQAAGLPDAPHVRRACWVALDQRMVLPDGQLSRWLAQWARAQVAGLIAGRQAPARRTPDRPRPADRAPDEA